MEGGANQSWEWEDAILAGSKLFYQLRTEGQGTVALDLEARTLLFRPAVYVDLPGTVVGIGSARLPTRARDATATPPIDCTKAAILDALGFDNPSPVICAELVVQVIDKRRASVKATGAVQEAMWTKKVVAFRTTWSEIGEGALCTAFAMSDPKDATA